MAESLGFLIIEGIYGLGQKLFANSLYAFIASIGFFVTKWENSDQIIYKIYTKSSEKSVEIFDFIIIGSGSAGSVVCEN